VMREEPRCAPASVRERRCDCAGHAARVRATHVRDMRAPRRRACAKMRRGDDALPRRAVRDAPYAAAPPVASAAFSRYTPAMISPAAGSLSALRGAMPRARRRAARLQPRPWCHRYRRQRLPADIAACCRC